MYERFPTPLFRSVSMFFQVFGFSFGNPSFPYERLLKGSTPSFNACFPYSDEILRSMVVCLLLCQPRFLVQDNIARLFRRFRFFGQAFANSCYTYYGDASLPETPRTNNSVYIHVLGKNWRKIKFLNFVHVLLGAFALNSQHCQILKV